MTADEGMPPVVHVSPRVQARGGIETLHVHHREMPLDQDFVALFDRAPGPVPGYTNLDVRWSTPLWLMRRRFSQVMAARPGRMVVYHNGWGLPLFHDLDRATRRVVMLHADPAYHASDLPGFRGLVDGVLSITPAGETAVAKILPGLAGVRNGHYRVPIETPTIVPEPRDAGTGRPWVLGYAGRLEQAQKRLDRLPEFLAALRATGAAFRFELIGAGSYRPVLEKMLGDQVQFHGWVSRDDYWRILARWDAVVFFSDHEGGPISLLEGMAVGAIPFYPACGGSWADEYLPRVNPAGHYPPGDMAHLARAVKMVLGGPGTGLKAMRETAQSLIAPHMGNHYQESCMNFLKRIAGSPRISEERRRAFHASDSLPLGLVSRFAPDALRKG